jgi:hypothetical protein
VGGGFPLGLSLVSGHPRYLRGVFQGVAGSCITSHPREASLPPPLLAGFMRGSPGIRRNSMHAGPRSGPFWGFPLREGELSRKWGTCASSGTALYHESVGVIGGDPMDDSKERGIALYPFGYRPLAPVEIFLYYDLSNGVWRISR